MVYRTFAEMLEAIQQHREGLVSDAELIQALQCDDFQLTALRQYKALPLIVADKCSLSDFDQDVQEKRAYSLENDDEQWPLSPERAMI